MQLDEIWSFTRAKQKNMEEALDIDKPILAAMSGFAILGGLELALACDLRFCAPNAEFAFQNAKWGFHAGDGGLIRLPKIVGLGHAMEIILSGERVNAEHAYRIGVVDRVVPAADLVVFTLDHAQILARRLPLSHHFAKDVMRRAVGMPMSEAPRLGTRSFLDLGHSQDIGEVTTAFREERDVELKGR